MAHDTKRYTRDGVTVLWQPSLCHHSTVCWKGLAEVFDPRKRPWVNMEGADVERIVEQVGRCPSGALSIERDTVTTAADTGTVTEEHTMIEALKNGPLMVYGTLKVKDAQGNEVVKNKATAFCRCGASGNKPYCDGSHRRIGFQDE